MSDTPTVTVTAARLHHLLSTAVPFAGTDKYLPLFRAVRLWSNGDGNGLTAEATDRYTLVRAETLANGGPYDAVIDLDDVKAWIRHLKDCGSAEVTLTVDDRSATLETVRGTVKAATVDGNWPALHNIIATSAARDVANLGPLRFDASFLARLGKIKLPEGGRGPVYLTMRPTEPGKPALFTHTHGGREWLAVVIMQARPE